MKECRVITVALVPLFFEKKTIALVLFPQIFGKSKRGKILLVEMECEPAKSANKIIYVAP
jgi:hypothetical protein